MSVSAFNNKKEKIEETLKSSHVIIAAMSARALFVDANCTSLSSSVQHLAFVLACPFDVIQPVKALPVFTGAESMTCRASETACPVAAVASVSRREPPKPHIPATKAAACGP